MVFFKKGGFIMKYTRYICKDCGKIYLRPSWAHKHSEKFSHTIQEVNDQLEQEKQHQEIDFLKCEVSFLKHQFKELKNKGFMVSPKGNAIEKIKQDEHRPERDQFKGQFNVVIKELKLKLQVTPGEKFDYHSILGPIESGILKSPLAECEV